MDDPLEQWGKKTICLAALDGPKIDIDIWFPPTASEKEIVKLVERNTTQGIRLIRKLTGTTSMIVSSGVRKEPRK